MFPNEDDKFTLTELVDGYAALFPLRVRVTKGSCEDHGESSAIAVDELYNLHFVKRAKVRVMQQTNSSSKHIIVT